MSFAKLGLTPSLCLPLARLGYEQPTPIQTRAIPVVLTGSDLLARAQTGTGKTAAFGQPMIERIVGRRQSGRPRLPRGLVLVPTRELAAQVSRSLSTYCAPAQLHITAIFGGVGMGAQLLAWCQAHPPISACGVWRQPDPYFRRPRSLFPDAPDGRLQFRRASRYIFGRHPFDDGDDPQSVITR